MKTRLIFLSIMLPIFTVSCKKNVVDNNNGLPYYQFTQDDKSKLLVSYDLGKELIYINQNNQEIKFKIIESVNGKDVYGTGTFWGSYVDNWFYYDKQEIVMQYAEGYAYSNCGIVLQRYPVGANYNSQYPIVGTPAFYGYMSFPLWNGFNGTDTSDNSISINFNLPTTSMNINGNTYSKVRIFESGKTEILDSNATLPFYPKKVNKIYYDQNSGIIGFDDLNGKNWRLQ